VSRLVHDTAYRGVVIPHGHYSKDYFERQRARVVDVCKPSNPELSLLRRWVQRFRRAARG
jgi:hypothetical protein